MNDRRELLLLAPGKLEIDGETKPLDATQVEVIARHLRLVFAHDIDPKAGDAATQVKLNAIHSPRPNLDGVVARC